MAFKDNLRKLLDDNNMKPVDLAKATGLSEAIVSNYLSGKKEPMGKTCFKIAKALNITVDELLETGFAVKQEKPAQEGGLADVDSEINILLNSLDEESRRQVLDYARYIKNKQDQE